MQELSYGGLSKATQRKLVALTKELQTNGAIAPDPGPRVRPGARLVREWRGRTHTVVVTEEGFEYAGKAYSSLSKIAQTITGAHWFGPRFFGLNRGEATGVQSGLTRATPLAREIKSMAKQTSDVAGRGPMRLRCAIYTRKSSEEGLEQDFNSLDAQREACEAFIASQKHEGWSILPGCMTMEDFRRDNRAAGIPAVTDGRGEGKIDVVVVYKVDRLTRSLSDFAKIVEIFDKRNVSFVSVT